MSGQITFQEELTINNVAESVVGLKDTVSKYDEIIVDATSLRNIDVAAIQMLFSAKKECLEKGKNLIFKTSDAVSNMISLVGVKL